MSKIVITRCPYCGFLNRRYRIYVYNGALIRCDRCGELYTHNVEAAPEQVGLKPFMGVES